MDSMSLSELITYSTVLIKSIYPDGTTGSGTGFIIDLCEDKENNTRIPVIVTNNHVVDGSIQTNFEFCIKNEDETANDRETLSFGYSSSEWKRHPNPKIDLCCLPIAHALQEIKKINKKVFYASLTTDLIPTQEQLNSMQALEDIVMVGYPNGLSDTYNNKPIIRKGITATHLKNNYKGNKTFLVDMACFPGSSGSPIFILNQGSYAIPNGVRLGSRVLLVGVLFQGPLYTAEGSLIFSAIPNMPQPITNIPMNLGEAIKSEEILAFEKLFIQDINQETNNG